MSCACSIFIFVFFARVLYFFCGWHCMDGQITLLAGTRYSLVDLYVFVLYLQGVPLSRLFTRNRRCVLRLRPRADSAQQPLPPWNRYHHTPWDTAVWDIYTSWASSFSAGSGAITKLCILLYEYCSVVYQAARYPRATAANNAPPSEVSSKMIPGTRFRVLGFWVPTEKSTFLKCKIGRLLSVVIRF